MIMIKRTKSSHNNTCQFCNSHNHTTRYCPIEKKISPLIRSKVGKMMEHVVSKINCPKCFSNGLLVLGTDAPSLDLKCVICHHQFEVKSKCLSCKVLPNDLKLNGGNYNQYIKRQKEGLDFIVIIYGVDRKTKILKIRKIIHIPNKIIVKNNLNFIVKKNRNLSTIHIANHNDFISINDFNNCKINLYNFIWNLINREKIDK